jgi:hypothetical protein
MQSSFCTGRLETYGNTTQFAAELDKLLEQPESLNDNALIAALSLYEKTVGKRFSKIEALADRGRFVLGYTHQNSPSDQALREHLGRTAICYSTDIPLGDPSSQSEIAMSAIPTSAEKSSFRI